MAEREGSLKTFSKDHEGREDLVGEHPFGDKGQMIAFVLFLFVWIADSFFWRRSTFLAESISVYIRLIPAVALFIFAGALLRSGLRTVFGEIREKPRVITTGVFSISRHPIYLSALLFYIGFFFTTLSLFSLVFTGVIFLFYNFIAAYEERLLEEKFGPAYEEYKEKTRRWL